MGVMGVMEHEVADSHTETTARSEQPQCVRETEGVESGGAGEVGTELAAGMPAETGNEEKRGQNHVVTSAPETKADDEEFDDEEQHWDRYGFFIDGRSSLDIRPCVEHKAPSAENSAEKTHPDKIDTPRGGRHSQNRVWDKYMEQLSDHGKITRTRELRHLVRRGVPENLRGKLWLAIVDCSSVRSQYHARYYEELLSGSAFQEKTQASWEIDKDLSRTFPRHRMFSTPSASSALRRVLVAFSVHKPHVGYCQSLNLLAATMLLFVNEEQAFWLLTTVLSDLLPDKYYSDGMQGCLMDQQCLRQLLSERLPSVDKTFQRLEADWQVVTMQWFLCLHVTCLPFESALRVWDVFLYDGAPALFRVALALFQLAKPSLASASNATQALQALQDVAQTVPDPDALIAVAFGDRKCKVVSGDMARLRHRFGPADAKGMPLSPQTRAKSGGGGSRQETPGRSDALPARASPESAPVAAPGSPRAAVGTQRSLLGQLARAGDDDGGAAGMRELSLAGGEAEAEAEGGGGKPRVLFKVPSFYTQVPDGGLGEVEIFDSYLAASPSAGGADEGAGEGSRGRRGKKSLSYDDVPSMQQGQRLAGGGGRADLADDSASEVGALPAGWITKGSHMASDVQVVEDYLTGDPKPPIAMADYVMGGRRNSAKGRSSRSGSSRGSLSHSASSSPTGRVVMKKVKC